MQWRFFLALALGFVAAPPQPATALVCALPVGIRFEREYIESISDLNRGSDARLVTDGSRLYRIRTGPPVVERPENFGEKIPSYVTLAYDLGEIGRVSAIAHYDEASDGWLVWGDKGVGIAAGDKVVNVRPSDFAKTGKVRTITDPFYLQGDARLVGSDNGLFRYDGNYVTQAPGSNIAEPGTVWAIESHVPLSGVWLVGTDKGLLRYNYGRGQLDPAPGANFAETGIVRAIALDDPRNDVWLVGTDNGLFKYDYKSGHLDHVPGGEVATTGKVWAIRIGFDLEMMVGADRGLFSYRNDRLSTIPGGDFFTGNDAKYDDEGTLVKGPPASAIERDDLDTRSWAVGSRGLYRYSMRPPLSGRFTGVDGRKLEFRVNGDCAGRAADTDFQLIGSDKKTVAADLHYERQTHRLTATLDQSLLPRSSVDVSLTAIGGDGRPYPNPITNVIRVSPPDDWWSPWTWGRIVIGHGFVFLFLIMLASVSDRAAGLLMHPIFGKLGLWWAALIWYFRPLQHWLLRRWFSRRKAALAKTVQSELLPLPMNSDTQLEIASIELPRRLRPGCRVWLTGNPGMGKSALAHHIEAEFFRHPTLAAAFKAFGFIPLVVPLRGVADPGKGDRRWPARIAETVLAGQGWLADENDDKDRNIGLVGAFIKRSGFVVLLDGANEVPWAEEIEKAAAAVETPGFLVLSQQRPALSGITFEIWHLPETIADAIEPLLALYLGEAEGRDVFRRLAKTPLLGDIKSGYDVRLVERLHLDGVAEWPQDRAGLYLSIISRMFGSDADGQLHARLAAFAWALWLSGKRQFADSDIDAGISAAFQADRISVTRKVGDLREFRHDQMRGYLAALHVTLAANPIGVLTQSEPHWPPNRSEQDLVWEFLRELADVPLRKRIYAWSLEAPENRIRIQVAFARDTKTTEVLILAT